MKKLKKLENQRYSYANKFAFLGSCFSENIHTELINAGFKSLSNPYGTLFSPKAIEQFILNSNNVLFNDEAFINRENIVLNYHANSKVYGLDRVNFENKLKTIRSHFLKALENIDTLFITFGTAWVYTLKSNEVTVANCQKVNQSNFIKRMLTIEEIVAGQLEMLNFLKEINPNLEIVYTVSPVRHTKDGLIENNRSKSRLFEAIGSLEERYSVSYFPSYELIIDELRDYRFFEEDGVHPNNTAINAVSDLFFSSYFSNQALTIRKEYLNYQRTLLHSPIHPELLSTQTNRKRVEEEFRQFKQNNGI
ncbi:MAG: GSCFA domain-containing protein [Lishizhenia sp.]